MNARIAIVLIGVFVLLGLFIWLARGRRASVSQEREITSQQVEVPHSIVQKSSSPISNIALSASERVAAPVPAIMVTTNEEMLQPPMTEPVQSPPSVTNTNEANAIILQRVKEERMPKVDMKMAALVIALKTYKQTLGTYPTGTWREISGALMGKNDKNFVFIEGNGWTNRQGELVDPWGGTYFFSFEANTLTVKSSGPNGIFGDADDIVRVKQY